MARYALLAAALAATLPASAVGQLRKPAQPATWHAASDSDYWRVELFNVFDGTTKNLYISRMYAMHTIVPWLRSSASGYAIPSYVPADFFVEFQYMRDGEWRDIPIGTSIDDFHPGLRTRLHVPAMELDVVRFKHGKTREFPGEVAKAKWTMSYFIQHLTERYNLHNMGNCKAVIRGRGTGGAPSVTNVNLNSPLWKEQVILTKLKWHQKLGSGARVELTC